LISISIPYLIFGYSEKHLLLSRVNLAKKQLRPVYGCGTLPIRNIEGTGPFLLMSIPYHTYKNTVVFEIPEGEGPLVEYDEVSELVDEILAAISRESCDSVAFNMSKKNYLNSSGLGEMVQVKDRLMDHDISLTLISLQERVRSLLSMVGMLDFFSIIDSEEQLD
jgi:anti-anti-sigma factor